MKRRHPADPKGLVAEAFNIDRIELAECRTILLDWALSLPDDMPAQKAAAELLLVHSQAPADHPMIRTLREATSDPPRPARRGGSRARRRDG